MESRLILTCTVPKEEWRSDKSSKDELARDFNQIYAEDLAGQISATFYPSSEERMQRLTTKVFGSKLLARLVDQDDFEILAVGRKYFNALGDTSYLFHGTMLSSRMQTFVVRDKQSGVVFFVDAGALHPTYLFCSGAGQPFSTDDRLLPEHKIYNSQTCMPFIPLKAKSESEQVNLVISPEEARKFLVINIETCLASNPLPQGNADTKTKKCPSDDQVSKTATKLSKVVEAAFEDAKDHIKNTKIDGLGLNDQQLDYYQKALENGTLGQLSLCVDPALLRARLEERAIKQGEIVTIETDFSTLNEGGNYVSAFPGRESILLNPKSEILDALYQKVVQNAANEDVSEIQRTLTTVINGNFASENLDADLIESEKVVDIENFIKKQQGVCRHKALLAAHFLGRLVKETYLPAGRVTHYRSYNQDLRSHTLVIYTPSQAPTVHYLIDCAQKLYFAISDQESFNQASAAYREKSLTGILHRFAVQHHFQLPERELDLPLSRSNVIDKLEEKMDRDESFEQKLLQHGLICPITQLPLRDPVKIGNDGKHAFERHALMAWFAKHNTCPVTRQLANANSIVPDMERKIKLLDIVANELKGIQPEEANGEISVDRILSDNEVLKYRRVRDLGLAGCYLRSTLADENKRKFTLEGASALARIEGKLCLKQKELRSTNSISDAEYNKELTDILRSEDKAIKGDLYATEILANIGLVLLGAVIVYGIVQAIYYAYKGTFFIAQQTREEEIILGEIEKNYFAPTAGV